MKRLADISKKQNIHTIVIVQYLDSETKSQRDIDNVSRVINCINTDDIDVIDLLPYLKNVRVETPESYENYFNKHHMSSKGNYFVSEKLREHIMRRVRNQ